MGQKYHDGGGKRNRPLSHQGLFEEEPGEVNLVVLIIKQKKQQNNKTQKDISHPHF